MIRHFCFLVVLLTSLHSNAHSFHVGLAHADYEEETQMLFCTMQIEYADLTHWLEDLSLNFNLDELTINKQKSNDWDRFELFILKHFSAKTNLTAIDFSLFDVELELDGRVFIYVYAQNVKPFDQITWTYSMLMGHSLEQQNKLEFKYITKDKSETFFAYFFEKERSKVITIKPN